MVELGREIPSRTTSGKVKEGVFNLDTSVDQCGCSFHRISCVSQEFP